jgi:thiol:disulfide interchange protein
MKKVLYFMALLSLSFGSLANDSLFNNNNSGNSLFGDTQSPLTAEEAFEIDHKAIEDTVKINIIIQPKHYLYKHKVKLIVNGKEQKLEINNAISKNDAHYGEIQAIHDYLNVNLKLNEKVESYVFQYQGCSEEFNICYPKQEVVLKKKLDKKLDKNQVLLDKINGINIEQDSVIVTPSMKEDVILTKKIEIETIIPISKAIEEYPVDTTEDSITTSSLEKKSILEEDVVEETIKEEVQIANSQTKELANSTKNLTIDEEDKLILKKEEGYFTKYLDIESLKETLSNNSLAVTLGIFFLSGILISFTPCVLPMIPIISSIVVGNKKETGQLKGFLLALSYVIGSSLTYAIIGGVAAVFSKNIQIYMQNPYVVGSFSFLLVVFAISLFGFFNLSMPNKLNEKATNISNKLTGGNYISVFFMGMISTLIVSPCVAAPLSAAIAYITTDSGDILTGALSLFVFGLGIGLVLIIITSFLNKLKLSNPTIMNESKYISGTLILAVAIFMSERILPVNSAIYLYQILTLSYLANTFARNYEKLKKLFIILILMITGVIYMNNQVEIKENILKIETVVKKDINKLNFINIEKLEDLKINNKYTLIKVTADWCTYCQTMEKDVFQQEDIINELSDFQLLKVDLTTTSNDKEKLMKEMGVVAPPALFFFKDGKMLHMKVGALSKERMLEIIEALKK